MPGAGVQTMPRKANLLPERLHTPAAEAVDCRDVMVVTAHPDDETIALGGQLARMTGVRLVHVTDGAPLDMSDALANGFSRREDYAAARRRELAAAMALAGIGPERLAGLGIPDQTAAFHMAELALRLATLFDESRIGWVLTHAYEGGHPDHDATAFAVHAAGRLLARGGLAAPAVLEFPLYHARDGGIAVQEFAPAETSLREYVMPLDAAAAGMKQRMLAEYRTQQRTLAAFAPTSERIRPAPGYDFRALPNGGAVYYAHFNWGLRPADWPRLAAAANRELGLPE